MCPCIPSSHFFLLLVNPARPGAPKASSTASHRCLVNWMTLSHFCHRRSGQPCSLPQLSPLWFAWLWQEFPHTWDFSLFSLSWPTAFPLSKCVLLSWWLPAIFLSGGPSLLTGTMLQMEEEEVERGDMAFLKDLLSPGPGANDEFSREWLDAFGVFEPPGTPQPTAETVNSGAAANPASSSPSGFLPSQLLDHSLSSTGQQHCTLLDQQGVASPRPTHESLIKKKKFYTLFSFFFLFFRLVNSTNVSGSASAGSSQSEPVSPAGLRINSEWWASIGWKWVDI